MLNRCKIVEKYIVLRTHTHKLSNFLTLTKDIKAINMSLTFCLIDKTGEHANSCAFTSAVLPEKSENLVLVDL